MLADWTVLRYPSDDCIPPLSRDAVRSLIRCGQLTDTAVVAVIIPVTQTAFAGTTAPAVTRWGRGGTTPPLVGGPGAWADSSSWDAVVSRLQRDGYTSTCRRTRWRA
jgi:hypothetical protein